MPIALDARKKPIGVKVHVTTGEGVEVTWSDGHESRYDFPYLRDHCPCALCNDEREKSVKTPTSTVLPMFKPRVTARSAAPVGNYAIQIQYSDGHATGIYSFECLREICPCEACGSLFRSTAEKTTG
jgi:DUF971 family protein